jgi:hypothetical protein
MSQRPAGHRDSRSVRSLAEHLEIAGKAPRGRPRPVTASQLDRSDFQSITGSHEGTFSAEPAAGDHPRGGW